MAVPITSSRDPYHRRTVARDNLSQGNLIGIVKSETRAFARRS
jgi:hypothetical protein